MDNFFVDQVNEMKAEYPKLFSEATIAVYGREMTIEEVIEGDERDLIDLMCQLRDSIKIEQSPYSIKKLAYAIQNSRSGIAGCVMTEYECAFCGEKNIWGNTATPSICGACSTKMATEMVLQNCHIVKKENDSSISKQAKKDEGICFQCQETCESVYRVKVIDNQGELGYKNACSEKCADKAIEDWVTVHQNRADSIRQQTIQRIK